MGLSVAGRRAEHGTIQASGSAKGSTSNDNALAVLERYDAPDTVHYVDPPYVAVTRSQARPGRYRHDMTDDDHHALADVLTGLDGAAVLSGDRSALYERRSSIARNRCSATLTGTHRRASW